MKLAGAYVFPVFFILILQVVSAGPVKTEVRGPEYKWMQSACSTLLSSYTFGYNATSSGKETKASKRKSQTKSLCNYPPNLGSMLLCMGDGLGSETKAFEKSLKKLQKSCLGQNKKHNMTLDDLKDAYQNATEYAIDAPTEKKKIKKTTFYQPVRLPSKLVKSTTKYYNYLYFNLDDSSMLAGMTYVYFLVVFILFGSSNLVKRLGLHTKFNNKYLNWYRANVSVPALFNGKHTEAPRALKLFSTLIPTRMESVVIFLLLALNILLSTVHYSFDYSETSYFLSFTGNVADRTGVMAFGYIPLLIILAGRNNILTSFTGIPFQSFIHYHKWVARLMWVNAAVHSAMYIARAVVKGSKGYFQREYIIYGLLATISGGVILIQALHCFRNMAYETFLITHIVLVAIFIAACWYHCYDIGYLEWIYVSWAVWGGDRFQRVIRMCMFGFRKANIELLADDTFKISVKHNKLFRPFPGAFAYIYFITPTMFWQSHPFTIIDEAINENETTVYIKAKAGITKRMKNYLSKIPGNKKTIRVSIEGPYGHRCPTNRYDTALLWAGGNGIPGPYYHAIDLAKRDSASRQQIKLLWTFRNPETLYWFYDELKALGKTSVQTDIYITGQIPKSEFSSDSEKEKKDSTSVEIMNGNSSDTDSSRPSSVIDLIDSLSGHINFHYGRPDLEQLIVENFTEETGPSVCVMTCGPNKMVDNVRGFTAKHLQSAKGRVDLFEELQVW